jgi:DNA-binding PadR family transcriptional regulator
VTRNLERGERSELECFVLGLVWQLGPCSAYDLRQHMSRSPSNQWSASAGALYPLVQRLERQRLLAAKAARTGQRARREYRITAAGLRELRRWIGPPVAPEAVTVSHDPLRSRARFLGALTPAEQKEWIRSAIATLDALLLRVQTWHEEFGSEEDVFLELLTRSGQLDVAARQEWLRETLARLVSRSRSPERN